MSKRQEALAAIEASRMASRRAAALIVVEQVPAEVAAAIMELATSVMALNLALLNLMEPETEAKASANN